MKTILSATCVNFGRLQYFFLIFHFSFSPFFPVTVLVLFWSFVHTLLCVLFFFLLWFISIFFFNLTFWFSFLPILFWVKPIACVRLFVLFVYFFPSPFSFPFSQLFPFHSIGTREVVTQKNLSGLVPIRDLRLDPSLLCSIPLLALSPNLLIVWLFLSIAYLVTKLRCK